MQQSDVATAEDKLFAFVIAVLPWSFGTIAFYRTGYSLACAHWLNQNGTVAAGWCSSPGWKLPADQLVLVAATFIVSFTLTQTPRWSQDQLRRYTTGVWLCVGFVGALKLILAAWFHNSAIL